MRRPTVSVIIPTYQPDDMLSDIIDRLLKQTVNIREILLVHTDKGEDLDQYLLDKRVRVIRIDQSEFDHGGTRAMAAKEARGDYLVYLTQDALPRDNKLIERLLMPFMDEEVAVSYARQLPREDCRLYEKYTRYFNYPPESKKKTADDIPKLGIKTFFCSDVASCYRREEYEKVGGFPSPTIFNEDMIIARKLIEAGHAVYYAANAKVYHSHNYSALQQFKRNFDNGVSHAEYPEAFAGVRAEKEGGRLVKKTIRFLWQQKKPWLIPVFVFQCVMRYLGFFLGKHYRLLPKGVVKKMSASPWYFTNA